MGASAAALAGKTIGAARLPIVKRPMSERSRRLAQVVPRLKHTSVVRQCATAPHNALRRMLVVRPTATPSRKALLLNARELSSDTTPRRWCYRRH